MAFILLHEHGRDPTSLLDLVIVIPSCFSQLKSEKCGNLCECTQHIQGIKVKETLKIIDYVVPRNSTSFAHAQGEICAGHSFDIIGKK